MKKQYEHKLLKTIAADADNNIWDREGFQGLFKPPRTPDGIFELKNTKTFADMHKIAHTKKHKFIQLFRSEKTSDFYKLIVAIDKISTPEIRLAMIDAFANKYKIDIDQIKDKINAENNNSTENAKVDIIHISLSNMDTSDTRPSKI